MESKYKYRKNQNIPMLVARSILVPLGKYLFLASRFCHIWKTRVDYSTGYIILYIKN
jgi:hypothetical protein